MEKKYPPFIERTRRIDPELFEVVKKNYDLAFAPGELDAKTKILITMSLDALVNSKEGVKTLAEVARNAGATEGEIKEALRIAYMVIGNKTLVASLSAF